MSRTGKIVCLSAIAVGLAFFAWELFRPAPNGFPDDWQGTWSSAGGDHKVTVSQTVIKWWRKNGTPGERWECSRFWRWQGRIRFAVKGGREKALECGFFSKSLQFGYYEEFETRDGPEEQFVPFGPEFTHKK